MLLNFDIDRYFLCVVAPLRALREIYYFVYYFRFV